LEDDMKKWTLMVVVAFLISGAAAANPAHEKLLALSESERADMLATLLRASGEECSSVTRTFLQGRDRDGNAYWNVTCARGASYSIRVDNNSTGSTRITDCDVLQRVGVPCFKPF
jgi:hypothetical protein